MPYQVVVLGMHRSGTSMLAGVLDKLGVYMGGRYVGADHSNPMGHFEDVEFSLINRGILKDAGGAWDKPPSHDAILSVADKYAHVIGHMVRCRDNDHALWGWKDPRTALTADLWAPHLSDPLYLWILRDTTAVARSLNRRNGIAGDVGIKLANLYTDRIANFVASKRDVLCIEYEAVLAEPRKYVVALADKLGIAPNDEAVAHVRPGMNHEGADG